MNNKTKRPLDSMQTVQRLQIVLSDLEREEIDEGGKVIVESLALILKLAPTGRLPLINIGIKDTLSRINQRRN